MATTATAARTARRTATKAKRVVRKASAHVPARRVKAATRAIVTWRMASLVATGTVIVLGMAALAAAAFDPRAGRMLRAGYEGARDTLDDLPSHLPDVSLPRLESLTRQFADVGQRLGGLIRATANRF
jgi:type II secretory pathway component PulF